MSEACMDTTEVVDTTDGSATFSKIPATSEFCIGIFSTLHHPLQPSASCAAYPASSLSK